MTTEQRKAFAAGFGCAVANLARDHMEDQLAWFLVDNSGMALSSFRESGLTPYDLDVIKQLFQIFDKNA